MENGEKGLPAGDTDIRDLSFITYGSKVGMKGCVDRARGQTRDQARSTQPFLTTKFVSSIIM